MPTPLHDTQIIVLLKAPRLGFAKTRLAAAIGEAAALAAYVALVECLTERIAPMTSVQLRFTPGDAAEEIEPWLQPRWVSRPQGDGDLGARLVSAFASSRSDGFFKTIIIGSDCPYLEAADLVEAAVSLDHHDVVLGPATDGGYWLIGLKEPTPELFTDIEWSSERVLQQTLSAIHRQGLTHQLLRTLSDVDSSDDWNTFKAVTTDRP
jgi:rSAM/selenodomain-associated transferase 1